MEQNEERWLGNCPKPYFRNDHHPKTLETKRIPVLNRIIHPTQSIPLRTAEYETRTLGGVRGALRSYLGAEPSTRLYVCPSFGCVTITSVSTEVGYVQEALEKSTLFCKLALVYGFVCFQMCVLLCVGNCFGQSLEDEHLNLSF